MTFVAAALLLLVATAGIAQTPGDNNDIKPGNEPEASQFNVVKDRTRSTTAGEETLIFRLLGESRSIPLAERKAIARQRVRDRRQGRSEFADRSDAEFLVEDVLRATDFYRGKLIELRGYTRLVGELPALPNDYDIVRYYRLWLYVEEGDSSPVDVYFLDLPDNWPTQGDVIDDVSVVGRFFKLIEYDDEQTGRPAYAPVIIAERVEFQPKIKAGRVVVNPALWDGVVRHKKRGWTNAERDLYYRLLQHARDGDYGEQQQQAKNTLRARIERYRTEAENEHADRTARAKRYWESHPGEQAEYERRLDNADRKQRAKLSMYSRYRDNPALFPTYADIVINDHEHYNAQLMTLHGRVRQITESPADDKIRYDLGTLYEVWFYTEDSQAHPAVVICTSVPEGLLDKARREGERLDEPVSVTGYFFKMYVYNAHDTVRFAPMLLAQRVDWLPQSAEQKQFSAVYVLPFIAVLAAGIAYWFWRVKQEDRQFRRQLSIGQQTVTMHDLDSIAESAEMNTPAFDQIEAVEETHFHDHGDRDPRDDPAVDDGEESTSRPG